MQPELSFPRIKRLPPYVFAVTNQLKMEARHQGQDIIDFGMGNPDLETPSHITDKLIEVTKRKGTKRYSQSIGVPRLRKAICQRYLDKYDVVLDPNTEAVTTIGSKEGLSHLALAISGPGDTVLAPNPCYPIHTYGFVIAGAHVRYVPLPSSYEETEQSQNADEQFFAALKEAIVTSAPKPLCIVVNFPSNPTAQCTTLDFFEELIAIAKHYGIWVIHDLAYGDITYDGYTAPSILQVKGATDIAVETWSLSKTYSMPGWRVGFVLGNKNLVGALAKIKSYLDYGTFTPIQVAAIAALEGSDDCIEEIVNIYCKRRNTLCDGLNNIGWHSIKPKASMFSWHKIPEFYSQEMGSLDFSKKLITDAKVAVAPGIGFGSNGEGYVRFALIENNHRIRQALRGIKSMFQTDGLI